MTSYTFEIEPVQRFSGPCEPLRRPREVASFSYDEWHRFRLDDSSLRYYYPPSLPADLNAGFDTFVQRDETEDKHLNALLDTMIATEKEKNRKYDVDIVTWRGMMTKIFTAPYDKLNGFAMNATYFQGSIFIEECHEHHLAQKMMQENRRSRPGAPSSNMMSYWGYKFETISVLPQSWDATPREEIESRINDVVNNNPQYCSVVRTGIGSTRMLLGGEVDALWDCKPDLKDDPINWVELKTSAVIRNSSDAITFERKLLKFWAQSFLLGVPKIIVGRRTQDGLLVDLEEYKTDDIPTIPNRGAQTWNANTCINFAARFLEWLKTIISTEGVWSIRRAAKSPVIEVVKIQPSGYRNIVSPGFIHWRSDLDPPLSAI
ncbi:decapping endonuclease targeting mRNA [Myotisia sp. PD_48]|nr:decapping endonuclease targeting mRNA [Myotisia sp. PD_48]